LPALFPYEKDLPEVLEEIGITVLAVTAAFVYRLWPERLIVGKVRFMSYDEVRKRINIPAYERLVASIGEETEKR